MPSEKTARSAETKRIRNRGIRSATRTMVSKANKSLQSGQVQEAEAGVNQAVRALDKAASKGIIHRNNAARRKSRLASKLKSLSAS